MSYRISGKSNSLIDRPLEIIEELGVGGGFERSFKITDNRFQAGRYVVGVDAGKAGVEACTRIVENIQMPTVFRQPFFDELESANTMLIGAEQSGGSTIFKIYLEFMDHYLQYLGTKPDRPEIFRLGIGYKWDSNAPASRLITHYDCLPLLTMEQIHSEVVDCYRQIEQPRSQESVLDILKIAVRKLDGKKCLFLSITEPDSARSSFDINFYPANLTLGNVGQQIYNAVRGFEAPEQDFNNLMTVGSERTFGHISAGVSRGGQEYFSVYYE